MGSYSGDVRTYDLQLVQLQASSIVELERNMAAAVAAIGSGRVVTAVNACGAGQGSVISVSIEHGVGQGYDPAGVQLRCYMATSSPELTRQYAAAVARATSGYLQVDNVAFGASYGNTTGGVLVYVSPTTEGEPDNLWQDQLEWHINAVVGSDVNPGTGALPIASWGEFIRRTGQDRILAFEGTTNVLTIYIESDLPTETIRIKGLVVQGNVPNRMQVVGVPTLVATGTILGWVNSGPGVEGTVTDAGVLDWTPYTGVLLRMTSGASIGAFTYVAGGAEAGVGVGRVGNLVKLDATGVPVAAAAPAMNDTYELLHPLSVRCVDLEAYHDLVLLGGGTFAAALYLMFLRVEGNGQEPNQIRGGGRPTMTEPNAIQFIGCGVWGEITAPVGVGARFVACDFVSTLTFNGGTWAFRWHCGGYPAMIGSEILSTGVYQVGEGSFFNGMRLEGCRSLSYLAFGAYGGVGGAGTIEIKHHSQIVLRGNWGLATPASDWGVDCQAYVAWETDVPTISGTVDDVRIGANVMGWADTPWKNTLPNQAQWTGGAAAAGADDNDFHVLEVP